MGNPSLLRLTSQVLAVFLLADVISDRANALSDAPGAPTNAPAVNLMADGDFGRPDLAFSKESKPGVWQAYLPGKSDAAFTIEAASGRNGTACARYAKTQGESENIHFDQIVKVAKDTVYKVTAWVRAEGGVKPVLTVQAMNWETLASEVTPTGAEWKEVTFLFDSGENEQVRFEWFAGAGGTMYTGVPGQSWLDNVSITSLKDISPALTRAFGLIRPHPKDEINVGEVKHNPVGNPLPLRPMVCHDGALYYEDGGEVALWGVNFQTSISWEYNNSKLEQLGIPLEADALNRLTDDNLDQLKYLDAGVIRVHLLPGDFSTAEGNLRGSPYLDALDHLIAKCHEKGIYVYLTLINEMDSDYYENSFMAGTKREEWLFSPKFLDYAEHYISALLNHVNRDTGTPLKSEPAIAVIEVMNEPSYPDYNKLQTLPAFASEKERYDQWLAQQGDTRYPAACFPAYRHDVVLAAVNRFCDVIRATGARQPIIWNLNWPQMVSAHEDVYQAVAESKVDGISFCMYPGQSDLPAEHWKHPRDLSGTNYLPFIDRMCKDYGQLRWLLGNRFKTKAKVCYEFETFYNESAYLYPAMAAAFRSLGAQIAPMWRYNLMPAAQYFGGSHYLNLYCTPRKAMSFKIASHVFTDTPRFSPYTPVSDKEVSTQSWETSFTHDRAVYHSGPVFLYSNSLDSVRPELSGSTPVRTIAGWGRSPLVSYDGSGSYFVEVGASAVDVTILPDADYEHPFWDYSKFQQNSPAILCELNHDHSHSFTLKLPGWNENDQVAVSRLDEEGNTLGTEIKTGPSFNAMPGRYHIEKK